MAPRRESSLSLNALAILSSISTFQKSPFGFDNLLCLFVRKAAVRVNNGVNDSGVLHLAFSVISNITEYDNFSSLGLNEQMKLQRRSGNMGIVRSTKYTEVALFLLLCRYDASFLNIMGYIGNVHSTSHNPSLMERMDSASSKSLASLGSMVKVVTFWKSSLGNFLFRDFGRNFVCCFFNSLRIYVWQSEFS